MSAFHLGCRQYRQLQQEQLKRNEKEIGEDFELISVPDPADIVGISQSHCSPSDLLRMQNILQDTLDVKEYPGDASELPVTSLSFLRYV